MHGVVVGDGAVIGAGAIVTKDVPSYAIVVGVPGKILRYRFPRKTVQRLLRLRWWQYTSPCLVGVPFHDVDAAIAEIDRRRGEGSLQTIDHPILRLGKDQEAWWVNKAENIKKAQRIYKASLDKTSIMPQEPPKPQAFAGQKLMKYLKKLVGMRKGGSDNFEGRDDFA